MKEREYSYHLNGNRIENIMSSKRKTIQACFVIHLLRFSFCCCCSCSINFFFYVFFSTWESLSSLRIFTLWCSDILMVPSFPSRCVWVCLKCVSFWANWKTLNSEANNLIDEYIKCGHGLCLPILRQYFFLSFSSLSSYCYYRCLAVKKKQTIC